ncbi:hypothetical protein VNO77_01791 [Canavalia gladiata]|uniref:Uncharacterized protein n=1 Tax=Canavalia gladiata TaxID=3824 RepID=A0AAN9R5J3_CANGL
MDTILVEDRSHPFLARKNIGSTGKRERRGFLGFFLFLVGDILEERRDESPGGFLSSNVPSYTSLDSCRKEEDRVPTRHGSNKRLTESRRQSAVKAPGYLLLTRNGHASNIVVDTPNPCDGLHYFEREAFQGQPPYLEVGPTF